MAGERRIMQNGQVLHFGGCYAHNFCKYLMNWMYATQHNNYILDLMIALKLRLFTPGSVSDCNVDNRHRNNDTHNSDLLRI
jgi:hypothetical protein